jgi:hypothetical protein
MFTVVHLRRRPDGQASRRCDRAERIFPQEDFVSLVLSPRVCNRYIVLGLLLYSRHFFFDYK